MEELIIYTAIILSALAFAGNEVIKNYALLHLPISTYNFSYMTIATIILIIYWIYQDKKNLSFASILKLNTTQLMYIITNGILMTLVSLFIIEAYNKNITLKNPINVGILGGIFTSSFIFSYIIDIIIKKYHNESVQINRLEIISLLIIVSGIGLAVYSSL
jgi:hypothetical protein